MYLKKHMLVGVIIGMIMPFGSIITGDRTGNTSWWNATWLTSRLPSMSSFGWPTAETTASLKDTLRYGLIGAAASLGLFATTVNTNSLPETSSSKLMALSLLGGLTIAGLSSLYFDYAESRMSEMINLM